MTGHDYAYSSSLSARRPRGPAAAAATWRPARACRFCVGDRAWRPRRRFVRARECRGSSPSTCRAVRRHRFRRARNRRPGERRIIDRNDAAVGQHGLAKRRAQRQRIARLADVAAGEGGGLAPGARPAIEDVLRRSGRSWQQRRPARRDIIGVIMGRRADRRLDIAGERGARRSARPRVQAPSAGRAVERAVADEAELADRRRARPDRRRRTPTSGRPGGACG